MTGRRRHIGSLLAAVAVVAWFLSGPALQATATPTTVVVPNANTTVEGNGNNVIPFSCDVGSMRYQQVYAGGQVGAGSISQLAFRDGIFPSTVIPNVTIRLSTTSKPVTGLDTVFANNVGSNVTTVFSGNLTLSGANFATAPGPFDTTIPLQTSFAFDPAGGNLLLDVTIPTCESTGDFDADFQVSSSAVMARVYAYDSTAASGQGDPGIFGGLVTQFTIGGTGSGCTVYRGIIVCPTTTTTGVPPRH